MGGSVPLTALLSPLILMLLLATTVEGALDIDGGWSPWSSVRGFCVRSDNVQALVDCGGGVMKRYRSCTNPAPQGNGTVCPGPSEDDTPCNTHPCPLPVEFVWSEWSDCSSRCGRGEQRRYKMCGAVRQRLPEMTAEHETLAIRPTEAPRLIPPTKADTTTTTLGPTTSAAATNSSGENATSADDSATTADATATTAAATTTAATTAEATTAGVTATGAGDNGTNTSENATAGAGNGTNEATTEGASATERPAMWIDLWELSLSRPCQEQPPDEWDEEKNQTIRHCNTWKYYPEHPYLWNHTNCPDPCLYYKCPKYAKCDTLLSTTEDMVIRCTCQMGTVMKSDNSSCIVPPPTTPTPRPIPTLEPQTKAVASAVTRTASTLIIIFLSITIVLFLVFRIFDPHRVIQMCEEISLLLAHLCLFPSFQAEPVPVECRVVSICIHYFFTVCFTFMLLEAVHMYAMVASVVKAGGMLATKQNLVVGWGIPAFVVLFNMCFEYESYGDEYHCWLNMGTGLLYGQYIPIVVIVVTTFTLIEAAGASEDYPALKACDEVDKMTAKISQRTLLIILPLVFASFITGTIAEYEQQGWKFMSCSHGQELGQQGSWLLIGCISVNNP